MLRIAEIFGPTIQGEGPHAGMKTLFVRVAGCDFSCSFCDSKFAWNVSTSTTYEEESLVKEVLELCSSTNTSNVILTGGNPCIYDFSKFVDIMHEHNISVDVETQGSLTPQWLRKVDLIVFSPKPPSSKMVDVAEKIKNFTADNKGCNICIKIPIFDEADFQFSLDYYNLVSRFREEGVNIDLYLSVGNTNVTETGRISERILNSYEKLIERVNNSTMSRVFILPQIHTLIWGNKQGV